MTDHDSSLDLAQQFAVRLTIAVFIVDRDGNILFYNRAAEDVLGRKFDETGAMPASTWSRLFLPTDESGTPLMPEMLPLMVTLQENRPAHGILRIRGIDNISRSIAVTSFPIAQSDNELVGAIAVFWETT